MGSPGHQMTSKTILAQLWKGISFLFRQEVGGE